VGAREENLYVAGERLAARAASPLTLDGRAVPHHDIVCAASTATRRVYLKMIRALARDP